MEKSCKSCNPDSDMITDIIAYYRDRANDFEKVYLKPERQENLWQATQILQTAFAGKEVLEIACGTGYWTEKIAESARTIFATDINESVIDIARSKIYSNAAVSFQIADIFNMPNLDKYESLFGGFIWSHIKLQDLDNFIDTINKLVIQRGQVVFMDNNYVAGSNLPITCTDKDGNTYQERLENGTQYKILKNFPGESFIKQLMRDKAKNINFIKLQYYWILIYTTPPLSE